MAHLPQPSSASERSPLLAPENETIAREDGVEERLIGGARDSDEDEDAPEPWTTSDKIYYSLLVLSILLLFIVTIIVVKNSADADFDWGLALKQALGGGLSGAAAMVLQVLTLMPLRTIMNYQYRYGTTMSHAALTLYREGGYRRYYSGLGAALVQAPVARFGDTAANVGALAFLNSNPTTRAFPSLLKTVFAAIVAALFRIPLTPIETLKTTLQTQGRAGWTLLRNRVRKHGISSLWYGALATAAATLVGFYPWFATYNYLSDHLPKPDTFGEKLLRQAFIGFVSSAISDTISNSLRVVKTYRQVNATKISYRAAAREVIRIDGIRGLLGRGLKTRILANGLQGLMFSVLWKLFLDLWNSRT